MGRRSSLERLPAKLRELVQQLWGEGATIDDLVALLRHQLGEDAPSRASVGRYAKRLEEQKQKAAERNSYLRELLSSFPLESRDDQTAVIAELAKSNVLEFLYELENSPLRIEDPARYSTIVNNLARALQAFELALNNNQKRKQEQKKALLDEVKAKLEKDKRIDRGALNETFEHFYG